MFKIKIGTGEVEKFKKMLSDNGFAFEEKEGADIVEIDHQVPFKDEELPHDPIPSEQGTDQA